MRRPEPTQEELRAAWRRCHKPTTWPRTFEEAMADATLSRLVRITALHPPRAHAKPAAPRTPQPVRKTTVSATPAQPIDRKRAAAGEREDD